MHRKKNEGMKGVTAGKAAHEKKALRRHFKCCYKAASQKAKQQSKEFLSQLAKFIKCENVALAQAQRQIIYGRTLGTPASLSMPFTGAYV